MVGTTKAHSIQWYVLIYPTICKSKYQTHPQHKYIALLSSPLLSRQCQTKSLFLPFYSFSSFAGRKERMWVPVSRHNDFTSMSFCFHISHYINSHFSFIQLLILNKNFMIQLYISSKVDSEVWFLNH